MLVYLVYPFLAVALFWGARVYGIKKWNDGFLSLQQTKALQGFCALGIMLHHCSQKLSSPDTKEVYYRQGLEPFAFVGYFFVAIFLFCSGYGLYKSYREKERYLKDFPERKLLPVIYALLISSILFAILRVGAKQELWFGNPFTIGGPDTINPYAWYVFAYLIFAFAFYLTFYYIDNENIAILITSIVVLLYMVFCDYWMYGNWWINTAPLFIIGILVGKNEEKLVIVFKRYYVLLLILAIAVTFAGLWFGDYTTVAVIGATTAKKYAIYRLLRLFAQILAAIAITFVLILLGMKIKIGNKFIAHMGKITLDFYLLHGLFVQMFSYCILAERFEPVYYIKNPLLYLLAVFVCSIVLATFFNFVNKKALVWLIKKDYVDSICTGIKLLFKFLVVVFIVLTLYWTVVSHNQTKKMKEKLAAYQEEYITYVDVAGRRMAAYVVGEGEHTIVIMQGLGDPCPTMTLRGLADALSKNNKVIVLDYFGNGFSDETDTPRTTGTIVDEIHTAVSSLADEESYILMPIGISGIYAMKYIYEYPEEVEAMIGLDAYVPDYMRTQVDLYNIRMEELYREFDKQGTIGYNWQKILNATGYVRLYNPIFTHVLEGDRSEEELDVLDEVIIERGNSKTLADEINRQWENYETVYGMKCPEDLPVLYILDKGSDEERLYYGINWRELYEDMITNPEIQSYSTIQSGEYMMYYSVGDLAKLINYYIKDDMIRQEN